LKLFVVFVSLLFSLNLAAHDYQKNDLAIAHPWAPPTPPGSSVGAVYFELKNRGINADTLIGVEVAQSMASSAQIHQTRYVNGVLQMRHAADGTLLSGKSSTKFQPGGAHVMLIDLAQPLKLGDKFELVLVFQRHGRVTTQVWVETPNENEPLSDYSHHH